jgi:hypothetical protein
MIDQESMSWLFALCGSAIALIVLLLLLRSNHRVDVSCATVAHLKGRA